MISLFRSALSQIKVKKRSNKIRFRIIMVILLSGVFLFLSLFGESVISRFILKIDFDIAHLSTTFQTREVLQFFIWFTELGNAMVVLPFIVILCITLLVLKRTILIIPLFISITGSTVLTYLIKILVQRTRPIEAVLVEHSYSFPSGHATFAIAFYGFMVYLLIRHSKSLKKQLSFFFAGITLIILLGLSRIALNVHYLSDVFAGYMIGSIGLLIGMKITEWMISTQKVDLETRVSQKKQWFVYALFICACVYYLGYAAIYQPAFVSKDFY